MTSDKSPLLYTVPRLLIFIPYRHLRHRWLIHIPWVAPRESRKEESPPEPRRPRLSRLLQRTRTPLCESFARKHDWKPVFRRSPFFRLESGGHTRSERRRRSFDGWPSRKRARQANERLTSSLASVISSPIRVEFSFLSRDRSGKIS